MKLLSDPYAVLGVSVAADDRRVLKRYHAIAKVLHPDRYLFAESADQDFANQVFARLVNPAYEKIKHDKGRSEVMAMVRLQVRRLVRDSQLVPQSEIARELMRQPVHEAEIFYEHAIATLAEVQFQDLERFHLVSQQLDELNLIYLQLKMGDLFVREKRTGLVAASEVKPATQYIFARSEQSSSTVDYARRHYDRAQQYIKKEVWGQAVLELRDALKIAPHQAAYHALLGFAYLRQDMSGMAIVHFRQALKLDPTEPLATEFAPRLNLQAKSPSHPISTGTEPKLGSLFRLFRR
ncbi:DnaJ domain-containing protein [Myxacorys almedinensis A]|uniref:DnaJ domain-containing protein n=1 Tax=Myxacorys almedinensis A TaxID=2690445 RepID=A0A8J7Z5R6_9CYAN|nr:DnaJ domain-containing protein [Myxacorys almedinensis A]